MTNENLAHTNKAQWRAINLLMKFVSLWVKRNGSANSRLHLNAVKFVYSEAGSGLFCDWKWNQFRNDKKIFKCESPQTI